MGIYQTITKNFKSAVKETAITEKTKTKNELVDEIHQTFMTEVDRLLKEARISKPIDTIKQDLIDKTKRLQRLGFNNAKEITEGAKEIERLRKIEKENEDKRQLINAINYFSSKYPQYKFITEESVKFICEKYGLVYGEVSSYIGTVPDENLIHIEEFAIEERDVCYTETRDYGSDRRTYYASPSSATGPTYSSYSSFKQSPLEIAAPISDFNMTDKELKDFKITNKAKAPDPVVLQPVFYGYTKYYLIVTAWGKEAEDSLIVNEKLN